MLPLMLTPASETDVGVKPKEHISFSRNGANFRGQVIKSVV
jgi:hypothetical protein